MDEMVFRHHVDKALDDLPDEFKSQLKNLEIMVVDEPNEDQVQTLRLRKYDRLFGLYTGIPQIEAGEEFAPLPDRIYLFRLPIIEAYETEEEIIQQIRDTLYHEIGHFFGIEEGRLRKLMRD